MIKNEIYLWDLCNKVYIKIKDGYREEFFVAVRKAAGNHKTIFKLLGNRASNFSIYENGKSLVSLDMVRKMLSVLNKRQKQIFMSQIENNLEFVKFGMRSSKIIAHPKFPIRFSSNLTRIVGHLVGDGGMQNKNFDYTVYYTNGSGVLIKQFKKDILDVFGDVKSKLYVDKRDGIKTIKFPSIIGHILTLFFGPQIRDLKHVPRIVLDSNKEIKAAFLNALYDDEGSVGTDRIALYMTNRNVIGDTIKC